VPPKQCPECGRFLAAAFVAALVEQPTPCPKCATPLAVEHGEPVVVGAAGHAVAAPAAAPTHAPAAADATVPAVAPTDDAPAAVRPSDRDPLEGWDGPDAPAPRDDLDRGPGVVDPATAVPAVLVGGVLGALLGGRSHRRLGALLGAMLGAVAAVLVPRD